MCRLAYITRRFRSLPEWLDKLDKSCGGHGIGVAVAGNLIKYVDLTVADSVRLILDSRKPALWHSRRVSCGDMTDALCHPFPCSGGYLAHNGHWEGGASTARVLEDLGAEKMSDTAVFARIVDRLGFRAAVERHHPPGVWLWVDDRGRLTVWKNGGELHYSPNLRAWGSEPAPQGEWYPVEDGYYKPGTVPAKPKPPEPLRLFTVPTNGYRPFHWFSSGR